MSPTGISLGQPATLKGSDFESALSESNICSRTFSQKFILLEISQDFFWYSLLDYRRLGSVSGELIGVWCPDQRLWTPEGWKRGRVLSPRIPTPPVWTSQSSNLLWRLWRTLTQLVFHFNKNKITQVFGWGVSCTRWQFGVETASWVDSNIRH